MSTPLDIIDKAIVAIDKLYRALAKGGSQQVKASQERLNIKAIVHAWFDSFRPTLNHPTSGILLEPVVKLYRDLLDFSDRSTSRSRYRSHLKTLKAELMRFRSQAIILITSGQIPLRQKPDFSKLVLDKGLLSIIDRRWDETFNCIEGAPLAATVMIGGLLEAILLSRIKREQNKGLIFKLKSAPKDKAGKAKNVQEWTLANYIDVCYELGWIRKPIKDIGVVLRDYRNLIHPREELKQKIHLNSDDAKMYWAVFSTMADQIVSSV
jgi:hypothetical protein